MVELFVQFPAAFYMYDIIICLFMISGSELCAITEENANMTQIFFCSVCGCFTTYKQTKDYRL